MPFMTALKKWGWWVLGSEFKASLSFLQSVSSGQGYMVSKTIIKQNAVFQCTLLMPLYIYIWFICYTCWVAIQLSVPHYKSQLSRASLKIYVFSNISHFIEIHLTFAVTSDVPVNCFFYCEHIFQSERVPFVYFCLGAFVFKSDPKIYANAMEISL